MICKVDIKSRSQALERHKQASSLVGIQADEARKSLSMGTIELGQREKTLQSSSNRKKNADSEQKRKLHDARQRTETRYNEQQVQRFKAHQYKAAIDEAKNRRKESHTVEVNYDTTDVVREIIAPVQSQGPGVIDFSKTHFHHAVTRHRAAAGPQVSVEQAQVDVVVKSGPASESRSELQVGIDRGSMVSGVEGALDARRRQIEREAKKKQTLHSRGKELGSGHVLQPKKLEWKKSIAQLQSN